MSETNQRNKSLRRLSSSVFQKEPILHEALIKDNTMNQFSSEISSNSSSSTSISLSANFPPQTHVNGILAHSILGRNMHVSRDENIKHCKDIDNEHNAVDSLQESQGLNSVRSHVDLAKTAHSVRALAKRLNRTTIHLCMNTVCIVTKARDNSLIYLTKELTEWLLVTNPGLTVYVDKNLKASHRFDASGLVKDIPNSTHRLKFWDKQLIQEGRVLFDFVITLGGDGTVLHASTLFQNAVPPIISFALGSLGFLTCFEFENFREILSSVFNQGVKTDLRMRFTCRVHRANGDIVCEQQVLNELTIDRGPSPYVTMLELYGDDNLLTVAQADGLIIATPTGSTAYSLSAGGSLVHPEVSCICITPICPHTLSFRPIMIPDTMKLKIKVPLRSRSTAWAAFDGRKRVKLETGDYVVVYASCYPFPTVKGNYDQYFDTVSRVLNWNSRKEQKGFKHLLSDKNKKICDEEEKDDLADETEHEEWDIDYSEEDS